MSLDSAIQHLLNAKRISNASQSYAKDNPGEWAKVKAYLEGGARPTGVVTEMGVGLVEVEDARRGTGPPPPPPPPPGGASLCLVPNGGFPSVGNGGANAALLAPKGIREDHLSPELVNWAAANGAWVLGVATNKNTADTLALANQYPTIKRWELDNEPYYGAWKDLAVYSKMWRDTAKALKQRDPSTQVLMPLYVQGDGGDYPLNPERTQWKPWVSQLLDGASDLPQYLDGWAIHPYSNPKDQPPQWGIVEKVKGQLEARGAMKPFHATEVGWSVGTATGSKAQVSAATQASRIAQFVAEARARSWMATIYVYCLRSWGTGFEESFGLFNTDGSKRPAADTFRSLV